MNKKVFWLILSCLMVAALLLASCAPAAVEEEQAGVTPGEEEVAPPTPPPDTTPPYAITGLAAIDTHDGKVKLSWNQSSAEDFDYYNIYVNKAKIQDVSGMTPIHQITSIATSAYEVSGLEDGTKYYFAVTALDKSGNERTLVTGISAIPTPVLTPGKGRLILDFPSLPEQITIRQIKDEFLIGVGGISRPDWILYDFRANGVNYFLTWTLWGMMERSEGDYSGNPSPGEHCLRRLVKSGAVLDGGPLLWLWPDEPWAIPSFAIGRSFEEQKDMIEKYIKATVRRFPEIEIWDLLEPIFTNDLGWSEEQCYEVFVSASKWIHEVNPKAKVMINMVPMSCPWFTVPYEPKKVMDDLMSRGLEADIIGIELYSTMAPPYGEVDYPTMEWVKEWIELFSNYNLPIIFSEVGVPGKIDSRDLWDKQADWLEQFLKLCHDDPNVIGVVWMYVRGAKDDIPYTGLLNDDYSLRPVAERLLKLANDWNPAVIYQLHGRAFLDLEPGKYDIIIGKSTVRIVVSPNEVTELHAYEYAETSLEAKEIRNAEYGFSFKLPSDWNDTTATELYEAWAPTGATGLFVSAWDIAWGDSLAEVLTVTLTEAPVEILDTGETVLADGTAAAVVEYNTTFSGWSMHCLSLGVIKDGKWITVNIWNVDQYAKFDRVLFEEIAHTLQFD